MAPIVTVGCLLSIYSSAGCDFIQVQVGFTPSNDAWNKSIAQFGIFMYQSFEEDDKLFQGAFIDGCRWYDDSFTNEFMENDQTWHVTKIMAYISAAASAIATMTAWLFVLTPIPVYFFWPGLLLPALMTAFLTEGSKFLIFDTKVCRSTAWYPSGADSLPRVAEECAMGATGAYTIASVAIFFISLILVCLRAPELRPLESNYGTDFEDDFDGPQQHEHLEAVEENHVFPEEVDENHISVASSMTHPTVPTIRSVPQHIERQPFTPNSKSMIDADDSRYYDDSYAGDGVYDDGSSSHFHQQYYDENSLNGRSIGSGARSVAPVVPVVSESRLRTKEKMQRTTEENSTELIDKFVRELNVRFDVNAS